MTDCALDIAAAAVQRYAETHPLIEWDMGRDECLDTIRAAGLPLPGKSACFFCPNSKAHEILSLPQPLIDRALKIEANAEFTAMKGLGRRWRWADLIRADRAQMDLFTCHAEMPCGCFDGA
jgi:hypothetical protein